MTAMRQFGCGVEVGVEAIQHFFQLVDNLFRAGKLPQPLVRLKIDESNFFGTVRWDAFREESREQLPHHAAAATWKHLGKSFVHQAGVQPLEKNRGAEQGDVDAPCEASLALGRVSRNVRSAIHEAQAGGHFGWHCAPESAGRCKQDYQERKQRIPQWAATSTEKRRLPMALK